jgi:hypothetical protein
MEHFTTTEKNLIFYNKAHRPDCEHHWAIIYSSFLLTSFEPEFSFHPKDGEGAQEDPLKYIVFL